MWNQVEDALAQVRAVKAQVEQQQLFRGWSGLMRIGSGVMAFVFGVVMSGDWFESFASRWLLSSCMGHRYVSGWLLLCLLSVVFNFLALFYWFLNDSLVGRDVRKLRPVVDVLIPIGIGALLTWGILKHGAYDLLYPTWMLCFGLANFSARKVLPNYIGLIGLYYLLCGCWTLLMNCSIELPLVMGAVFGFGEVVAGSILHIDKQRKVGLCESI